MMASYEKSAEKKSGQCKVGAAGAKRTLASRHAGIETLHLLNLRLVAAIYAAAACGPETCCRFLGGKKKHLTRATVTSWFYIPYL